MYLQLAARKLRVIAIFTVPIFVFFLLLNLWANMFPNTVDLTFDAPSSKYSILKGKLSLTISNDGSKNTVHASVLDGKSNIKISASQLFETKSTQIIKSDDVTFNNSPLLSITNLSAIPQDINVIIKSNDTGLFHGTLNILSENSTYIPISVDMKPDFVKIAIFVANGLASSVVILNVIGYVFLDRKQEKTKKDSTEFTKYLSMTNRDLGFGAEELASIRRSLDSVLSKLKQSKPDSAYAEFSSLKNNFYKIYAPENVNDINWRDRNQILNFGVAPQNQQEYIEIKNNLANQETNFSLKKYTTTTVIEKNIVAGITGVAFGLIIGFIPLLQSDYIDALRQMEFSDYLILFGLGVGVGNLHEAVSKIWEKSKDTNDTEKS
jgi:hypothetical protein